MRRLHRQALICALLIAALLGASSQYLAHFHVAAAGDASSLTTPHTQDDGTAGLGSDHCGLCLQLARLPAAPPPQTLPQLALYLVGTVTPESAVTPSFQLPTYWPPARAPPKHC